MNIDPTEHETSGENAEAPEVDIPDDTPADPENLQEKEKPVLTESDEVRRVEITCSRYGRVIKEPRWHKDYIGEITCSSYGRVIKEPGWHKDYIV